MNINEFLEDFDNSELQGPDWDEQMEYAVYQYNQEFDEDYKAIKAINAYKMWKYNKYQPEL